MANKVSARLFEELSESQKQSVGYELMGKDAGFMRYPGDVLLSSDLAFEAIRDVDESLNMAPVDSYVFRNRGKGSTIVCYNSKHEALYEIELPLDDKTAPEKPDWQDTIDKLKQDKPKDYKWTTVLFIGVPTVVALILGWLILFIR